MYSNKKEPRINCKNTSTCKPFERTKSATVLPLKRTNANNSDKLKLKSSTYSRLPVSSKIRKPHNCINPTSTAVVKKLTSPLTRKSVSLVELTETPKTNIWAIKKWTSKENIDEMKTVGIVRVNLENSFSSSNEIDIAKKVCKMFILNAWRRSRSQVISLQNMMTKTKNEVDNLNIQVVVLRDLLDYDSKRVAICKNEAADLKLRLEEKLEENNRLQNEISSLQSEKNIWKTQEQDIISNIKSLKDEVTLLSEQNKYLRRECDDFEKVVSDLKQKESNLQHQLNEATNCLKKRYEDTQEIIKKFEVTVNRMSELKMKNKNLSRDNENKERKITECINKINNLSVELNNSQNVCKVQSERIVTLEKDLASVKKTMETQTVDIVNLKNTVEQNETEKEQWNNNLIKIRNRVIFEAIRVSLHLFLPYHQHCNDIM